MAWVNPNIDRIMARDKGVRAAVRGKRDQVAGIAEGLFASHDNPGGHEITTSNGRVDAFVSLEGPAPLSVEFGHWQETKNGREFVEGLHILGRAVAQVSE